MAESEQKLESLKKVYAEMILTAAREAAARVLAAESKARRFEHDLACTREEASRLLQRSRELIDAQDKVAENRMLNQKMKFDEFESQLNDTEMVILDLRAELDEAQDRLSREKKKARLSLLQNEWNEKVTAESDIGGYELLTTSLDSGHELITMDGNFSCSPLDSGHELIRDGNLSYSPPGSGLELVTCSKNQLEVDTLSLKSSIPGESTKNISGLEVDTLDMISSTPEESTKNISGLEVDTLNMKSSAPEESTMNISGLEVDTLNMKSSTPQESTKNISGLEVDTLNMKSSTPEELTKNMAPECDVHCSNDHSVFCHVKETELLTSFYDRQEHTSVKEPGLLTNLETGLKLIAETYSISSSDEDEPNSSICCPACAAEARLVKAVSPKVGTSGPRSNSTHSNNFMSMESASESEEEVQHEKHEPVSVVRRSSRKRAITAWDDVLRTSRKRTSRPGVDGVQPSTRERTKKPSGDVRRSTRKRTIKPWGDATSKLGVRSSRQFKKHGGADQQLSRCKSNKVNNSFKSGQDTFPTEDGTELEDNLGQEFPGRKFKLIEDLQNDMELTNVSVKQAPEVPLTVVGSVDVVSEQDDTMDLRKDTELTDVVVEHDELAAMYDLNSISTVDCEAIGDAVSKPSDAGNADTNEKPYITYSRRKKKTNSVPEAVRYVILPSNGR